MTFKEDAKEEKELPIDWDWFLEPVGFRPPSPKPTTTTFTTATKKRNITLNLPPKHSLWSHWLWNASKYLADFLELYAETLVVGKRVVELGAASALPSIICCLENASVVCATDYPDVHVIRNIKDNAEMNLRTLGQGWTDRFSAKGYIWGQDMSFMDDPPVAKSNDLYDLVLISDCIFVHKAHCELLKSISDLLAMNGICLVTFSHHNPQWIDRDLAFFTQAQEKGFKCQFLGSKRYEPMFKDDVGDEVPRATVYCWGICRRESSVSFAAYLSSEE